MANKTGIQKINLQTMSAVIDTDLDAKEMYLVNFDTSADRVVNLAADASLPLLVLEEGADGSSSETVGSVATSGITKVIAGGTVTAGDKITADSNGKGIKTITDKDNYAGFAIESAASGDSFMMMINPGMVSAT
jgi:hypothetical protein